MSAKMSRKVGFVMKIFTGCFALAWLLAACGGGNEATSSTAVPSADLILVNGNVVTMDPANPQAEALAVAGDRILAVGTRTEIEKLAHPGTKTIDMQGGTAIPGFIEGHGHLLGLGNSRMILDLKGTRNWDEVVEMVREAVVKATPGTWILGRGWHQEKWDRLPAGAVEGFPNHHSLSAVSPDNPVLLRHASGHGLFANQAAMELAGVSAATQDPAGGRLIRDSSGEPTGFFSENAMQPIEEAHNRAEASMTPAEREEITRKAIDLAMQECLSKGITSFQDAGSSFALIDLFKEMADAGQLEIRLWVMASDDNTSLLANLPRYQLKGYANQFLTLGGIKRYMDGALGSRGAWLLAPYEDLPESSGQNLTPLNELEDTARIALANNLQYCVHAIGDRGNREVLDLFARMLQGKQARWRIEHAQHLDPADIPRFGQLNAIASMQAIHCTSDAPFVVKRLGEERARTGAYPWRALIDSGAVVTNGTDSPVEDVAPLPNFYAMVTRRLTDGQTFFEEQKLDPVEALRCYTANNAYAAFEEDQKGSLSTGKLADITVLSQDITAVPVDRIPATEVRYTIVGGQIKYQR